VPVVCEPFRAWVLETALGLEPLARAGVQLVADAAPHERMKLRLLNAGHQALAYAGQAVGATRVAEAVRDPDVLAFLEAFWDREAVPSLTDVPAADVAAFRAALPGRFANRALPDTLERLAVDGAERLAAFVVPVLRDRLRAGAPVGCSVAAVALRAWTTGAARGPEAGPCPVSLGDLASDPRVRAAHAAVLADLRDGGPRHALARVVAGRA
jgi:mannitol 2-dehydrogenase